MYSTATLVQTDGNWYAVLFTVCSVNLVAALNYARNAVVNPIEDMIDEKTKSRGDSNQKKRR